MTPSSNSSLLKVALGLSLMFMGGVATLYLWLSYQRAAETRRWTPVEAVIVTSQLITDRPTPHSPLSYKAEVHYRYTYQGTPYTGTRIERVEGPSNKMDKPKSRVAAYPVGSVVTCYVNPQDPGFAILRHSTLAALYSIWFPLLFVVGGAGMIFSIFRRPPQAVVAKAG